MEIPVKGGKVRISTKADESFVSITASDYGGCDLSPPDSITIEMTSEEARLVATCLLESHRELYSRDAALKAKNAGAAE